MERVRTAVKLNTRRYTSQPGEQAGDGSVGSRHRIRVKSFEGRWIYVHDQEESAQRLRHPGALITERYLAYLDLCGSSISTWRANSGDGGDADSQRAGCCCARIGTDDREGKDRAMRWSVGARHQVKAAAELLHDRETLRSAQWTRPDSRVEAIAGEDYEPELEVDLFSLLAAFRQVLERARERPPMLLPPEQVSIETRIEQLLERLSETEACGFGDLFEDAATRADMIVTFLALLEMIRLKLIRVFQSGPPTALGPTRWGRRIYSARPQDAPHPYTIRRRVRRIPEEKTNDRRYARPGGSPKTTSRTSSGSRAGRSSLDQTPIGETPEPAVRDRPALAPRPRISRASIRRARPSSRRSCSPRPTR